MVQEYSNNAWWCDGDAQNALDALMGAGVIDVQGTLLDTAREDAREREYFDQERQGAGSGFFVTVHSLPLLGRDIVIYLRQRIQPEFSVDGKFRPLELEYYGCLVGDGWAVLVDRVPELDELDPDFRDRVFKLLGPGQTLWWDDKARTGQHTQQGQKTYDIILQPAGDAKMISLVISEPEDRIRALYKWMLDPEIDRDDMLWAGGTLMICENWSGIAVEWKVLNSQGNPLTMKPSL